MDAAYPQSADLIVPNLKAKAGCGDCRVAVGVDGKHLYTVYHDNIKHTMKAVRKPEEVINWILEGLVADHAKHNQSA